MEKLKKKSNEGQTEIDFGLPKEAGVKKILAENMVIQEIPIEQIGILPGHPRKSIGNTDALQESIAKTGLQEPLLVIKKDDGMYDTFDGGRRREACKKLGHKSVLSIVSENLTAEEAIRKSFIINTERKSLTIRDKGLHIRDMLDKGYTYRDLEILLGYGSAANLNYIVSLLDLPKPVQSEMDSGNINMAQGLSLLKLPSKEAQEKMAKRIVKENLSARKTEEYIHRLLAKENQGLPEPQDNIPTDHPGLIRRRQVKSPEQLPESMDSSLAFPPLANIQTGTKAELQNTMQPNLDIISDTRSKVRSGGILGVVYKDAYSSSKGADGQEKNTRLIGSLIHSALTNRGFSHSGRILVNIIDDDAIERHRQELSKTDHTNYRINTNILTLDIYRKNGSKNPRAGVITKKSRPTDKELLALTSGIWTFNIKDCGGIEGIRKEISKRFIALYSYAGDSILDPFVTCQSVIGAAIEMNRVPTGYIPDHRYNPDDWKNFFDSDVEPTGLTEANASDPSGDVEIAEESSSSEEPKAMHFTNDASFAVDESSIQESL